MWNFTVHIIICRIHSCRVVSTSERMSTEEASRTVQSSHWSVSGQSGKIFRKICRYSCELMPMMIIWKIEEVIEFCKLAGEAGVDVLDVSRGNIISAATKYEVPPIDIPSGFNIDNAARIRKETGMLTIGVGRINTVGARAAEEGINKAILREGGYGCHGPCAACRFPVL